MKISFYKAGCGDAARISFIDDTGRKRNIFIDSGYERSYRDSLNTEIAEIAKCGEVIDLWIISHIHDDHIGGVINYLNAISKGFQTDIVEKWIYNPPRPGREKLIADAISRAASISQGENLSKYLFKNGIYPESAFTNATKPIPVGDLTIKFLSPGIIQLENLHNKYRKAEIPFEKNEDEMISEAKGAKMRDHHVKAEDFDLSKWKEDDNVENGSSIAFITERRGCTGLWLADAHPSVVSRSLKRLGYSYGNPIVCQFVKVAHHGSAANNSEELFSLIKCDKYIFSVNGDNKSRLPNKESLIRILRNPQRDYRIKYNFYFTYDDQILRSIFSIDPANFYESMNFEVFYENEGAIMMEFV